MANDPAQRTAALRTSRRLRRARQQRCDSPPTKLHAPGSRHRSCSRPIRRRLALHRCEPCAPPNAPTTRWQTHTARVVTCSSAGSRSLARSDTRFGGRHRCHRDAEKPAGRRREQRGSVLELDARVLLAVGASAADGVRRVISKWRSRSPSGCGRVRCSTR